MRSFLGVIGWTLAGAVGCSVVTVIAVCIQCGHMALTTRTLTSREWSGSIGFRISSAYHKTSMIG